MQKCLKRNGFWNRGIILLWNSLTLRLPKSNKWFCRYVLTIYLVYTIKKTKSGSSRWYFLRGLTASRSHRGWYIYIFQVTKTHHTLFVITPLRLFLFYIFLRWCSLYISESDGLMNRTLFADYQYGRSFFHSRVPRRLVWPEKHRIFLQLGINASQGNFSSLSIWFLADTVDSSRHLNSTNIGRKWRKTRCDALWPQERWENSSLYHISFWHLSDIPSISTVLRVPSSRLVFSWIGMAIWQALKTSILLHSVRRIKVHREVWTLRIYIFIRSWSCRECDVSFSPASCTINLVSRVRFIMTEQNEVRLFHSVPLIHQQILTKHICLGVQQAMAEKKR